MKRTSLNENNLVEHLIKGDEAAYALLVDLHYNRLCNYASTLARDNFISEDIVQNVIVKLWQRRELLNSDMNIKSYLYKSVYNEFVDHYRKYVAVTTLEKKYIEGADRFYENEEHKDTERLGALIEREIEQLPPKCKAIFLLSKRDGLTYNEIAEYQNISVNTVENHMTKAFAILREQLKAKVKGFLFLIFGKQFG